MAAILAKICHYFNHKCDLVTCLIQPVPKLYFLIQFIQFLLAHPKTEVPSLSDIGVNLVGQLSMMAVVLNVSHLKTIVNTV